MAKILLSSIGTGIREKGYNKANYKINNKIYKDEKFISKALCENLNIDKLFLIGTKQSIWEVVAEDFSLNDNSNIGIEIYEAKESNNLDDVLPRIEKIIDEKLGTIGSKCFIINYGLNEAELWENFDNFLQIGKNLTSKDEVYLDITHSFRSLSLMSFVMSEFISNTLNEELNIKGIYYGMLEYSKENQGITPVVDLSIFFELLRWSKAIKSLKKYGNSREILILLKKDNEDIVPLFENFTDALSISDIVNLQKATKNLQTKISILENSENKIYNLISKDLKEFIKLLNVRDVSLLQYKMAKWYCENQNYALAYILLAEAVVSSVAEDLNLDCSDEEDRKIAKKEINKISKQYNSKKDNPYDTYYKINNIRNYIAHALDEENRYTKIKPKQAIENLPSYIDKLNYLFKNKS